MAPKLHARSTEAAEYRKLYSLPAWAFVRKRVFVRDLYTCQRCGCIVVEGKPQHPRAAIGHHRRPHKGDRALFFDDANVETVCKSCHDTLIQREEAKGFVMGSDASGRPIDPRHPWNR